jgi:hypothetical protein
METNRRTGKINETKTYSITNKIEKPLAKLTTGKRKKTQINTTRDEKGTLQQTSLKPRAPLGNILKHSTPIN